MLALNQNNLERKQTQRKYLQTSFTGLQKHFKCIENIFKVSTKMAEEKTCFLKYDLFENGCIEKHWSAKSPAKVLYPQKSTSDVFLVSSTVYKIFCQNFETNDITKTKQIFAACFDIVDAVGPNHRIRFRQI